MKMKGALKSLRECCVLAVNQEVLWIRLLTSVENTDSFHYKLADPRRTLGGHAYMDCMYVKLKHYF